MTDRMARRPCGCTLRRDTTAFAEEVTRVVAHVGERHLHVTPEALAEIDAGVLAAFVRDGFCAQHARSGATDARSRMLALVKQWLREDSAS